MILLVICNAIAAIYTMVYLYKLVSAAACPLRFTVNVSYVNVNFDFKNLSKFKRALFLEHWREIPDQLEKLYFKKRHFNSSNETLYYA